MKKRWKKMSPALKDKIERVAVTAAIAAIAVIVTDLADVTAAWVPVVALGLNTVKVWLAGYVGDPGTGGFVKVAKV